MGNSKKTNLNINPHDISGNTPIFYSFQHWSVNHLMLEYLLNKNVEMYDGLLKKIIGLRKPVIFKLLIEKYYKNITKNNISKLCLFCCEYNASCNLKEIIKLGYHEKLTTKENMKILKLIDDDFDFIDEHFAIKKRK